MNEQFILFDNKLKINSCFSLKKEFFINFQKLEFVNGIKVAEMLCVGPDLPLDYIIVFRKSAQGATNLQIYLLKKSDD